MIKEINTSTKLDNETVGCIIEFEEEDLHGNAKPILGRLTKRGCIECISHKLSEVIYPHFWRTKKNWYLHRYIFHKYCEEIPEGMVVMHKCDNPRCINPDHLELGTQKDNIHDMIRKGRAWFFKKRNVNEISTLHQHVSADQVKFIILFDVDKDYQNILDAVQVEVWAA